MSDYSHNFDELFTNLAKANQAWFSNLLKENQQDSKENAFLNVYQCFFDNTKTFLEVQQRFYADQLAMWGNVFKHVEDNVVVEANTNPTDKRFNYPEWESNPFFAYLKYSYLNVSEYLINSVAQVGLDDETKSRMEFFMRQYLDAISPTNFAFTNPEVIKTVVETGGESLIAGVKNMTDDMNNGYIAMTDESAFEIGRNIAITKGKVVFRNELIELIHYAPATPNVYEIPLLIIPPFINKYYILDLQPEDSLVKYLVSQGFTVFMISWKSADKAISDYRWGDYANHGVIEAIRVTREISNHPKINVLGYCLGGVILTTAYLLLKDKKLDWINVMGHMTTMLDHSEPGDIKYFIGRDLIDLEESKQLGDIISGRILSHTFSALRANELIWNYWVNNYLLGKTPKPFDILFWNNDTVDLPVAIHSFVLKALYLNNEFVTNQLEVDGVIMKLADIDCPLYIFASEKDHIVPWRSAYLTTHYVSSKKLRFVLGASGHTAGVINPVSTDKRNYWVSPVAHKNPDEWFKTAKSKPGSWWKDYSQWLSTYSGAEVKAKKSCGNSKYKPIQDAPGEYVLAKGMPLVKK